eukprot:Phypoly_transcript_25552.p1 GENE.Phypoly_transcript_25552~~Phypoly_transcript_25552.p1  ORF type:complete len:121 (+),score=14.63 Phypoly_transcript_25552:111-473(+)
MSDTIERRINLSAETKETFTDRACPEGSYTGSEALADDVVRHNLGQKAHYPLHVANTEAPEYLSEEAKELRARDFAAEKGSKPRDLDTHLGDHPQWRNTDIPYSSLQPELVSDKEKKHTQ